jgi:IS1 family transposase/transposase-like protein
MEIAMRQIHFVAFYRPRTAPRSRLSEALNYDFAQKRVLSLDSVYGYERAISENAPCKLLMYDTHCPHQEESMEFTTCYCLNPQCTHYGKRGGTHLVRRGADRGIPRLLCTKCKGTFSARQGTAYFGVRTDELHYTIAMWALAEGNSLRGTGRIVEVDKDTVCDWLDRAGRHCRAVTTSLFDTLHITECQVDELWSFVRKKEAHLSVTEKVVELYGDAWVWIAFAPAWRLVAAFVVGKRDQGNANLLIECLHAVSCGYIPFFTSDQLPYYARALLHVYGIPEVILHIPGKRGPKPKPKLLPPADLH